MHDKWEKNERIYRPGKPGVPAPIGRVWEDYGDEVAVVGMYPQKDDKVDPIFGIVILPKSKLARDRRSLRYH